MKMIEKRIAQIEEEIAQLQENRRKHQEMYEADLSAGMMAEKCEDYGRFFGLLNVSEAILNKKLTDAQKEKQQCMDARLETRREIKALEKLSDIELAAYREQVSREEDNSLGDIITYKVATK
jgi:flagellar export protein FliJ